MVGDVDTISTGSTSLNLSHVANGYHRHGRIFRDSGLMKGVAFIMALGFGLPGIGISAWLLKWNLDVTKQAQWVMTEAYIDALPKTENRDFPDKDLQYAYEFEGVEYQGLGVGGFRMKTNGVDRELKNWLRTTEKRMVDEEIVPCWVDPKAPESSTLIRANPVYLSYFLGIFTFSHGLLGIGMFLTSLFGGDEKKKRKPWNKSKKPKDGDFRYVPPEDENDDDTGNGKKGGWLVWFLVALGGFALINGFVWPSIQMIMRKPEAAELPWVGEPSIIIPTIVLIVSGLIMIGIIRGFTKN